MAHFYPFVPSFFIYKNKEFWNKPSEFTLKFVIGYASALYIVHSRLCGEIALFLN
ncbi:MAG: hypothetical protein N2110_05380 [Flavobacteriales bacterium]|nr:hypothetical protein [Flavobacteriales bacterium]MCX7768438.1 hypothetical protein [Flavobacteriales bacterium]MDW8409669.1 hypothetical protein [Flavobacteriales bacterium]